MKGVAPLTITDKHTNFYGGMIDQTPGLPGANIKHK